MKHDKHERGVQDDAALTIEEEQLKAGFDILENAVKVTMAARSRIAAAA